MVSVVDAAELGRMMMTMMMLLLLLMDGHNFDLVVEVECAAVNIAVHMAADIVDCIVVLRHNLDLDLIVDNIDFDY